MRLLNAFVLCLSTASALVAPRAASVDMMVNDIRNLDNAVKDMTASLNGFTGGLFVLLQTTSINANLAKVHTSNRVAYYDAQLFGTALSTADSQRVINVAAQTLAIDNPKACDLLKSKKKLFDSMLYSPLVLAGLKTLLDDHLSLSDAVMKRCATDVKPQAQAVVDIITDALEDAIKYFS